MTVDTLLRHVDLPASGNLTILLSLTGLVARPRVGMAGERQVSAALLAGVGVVVIAPPAAIVIAGATLLSSSVCVWLLGWLLLGTSVAVSAVLQCVLYAGVLLSLRAIAAQPPVGIVLLVVLLLAMQQLGEYWFGNPVAMWTFGMTRWTIGWRHQLPGWFAVAHAPWQWFLGLDHDVLIRTFATIATGSAGGAMGQLSLRVIRRVMHGSASLRMLIPMGGAPLPDETPLLPAQLVTPALMSCAVGGTLLAVWVYA